MKKLILGVAALSLMAGSAYAANCTPQDLQSKMTDMQTKYQQVVQKDPSKSSEWQERMMDWLTKSKDVKEEDACDYIDSFIKIIEADL